MEEIKYDSLFIGFVFMVSFHNSAKSILFYRSGRDKSLSLLKIIFNVSSLICSISSIPFFLIINMSLEVYKRINYVQLIFNSFMMQSLAAYILLLISKYEKKNKSDMWINVALLVTRAVFNVAYIFSEIFHHNVGIEGLYLMNLTIIIDIVIDAYVMVRFIQILEQNNRQYYHFYYNYNNNNSLKIFNLIIYWNVLTILISLFYHSIIGISIFTNFNINNTSIKLSKLSFIIYLIQISLSYLVTIDTEIKLKRVF
ncbi:hypothetical protein RclHR1_10130006 [Rhizophagus clarus]|uniref:G-protein coupled receptors family 1 profile domain-containing protein n=1 Tax=Rhizophagus clarus TaxID=94130 RepID=A0A2Z6QF69_9GLOM|nr:hypothetical protein RclHR1_10130006 [Rhizophagus clarus]